MVMNQIRLKKTTVCIELPNESSKEEFLSDSVELIAYLRKQLNNYDITIEVFVKEVPKNKYTYTPEEKYNRLKTLNPNIEILKNKLFLDI